MTVLTSNRVVAIDGLFNFRDVGGYPTRDGRTTRWRTLYRSDSLHLLTPTGVRSVLDLGVRSVVDLRYPAECAQAPCALVADDGTAYHAAPLFEDPQRGVDGSVLELDAIYRLIVDT